MDLQKSSAVVLEEKEASDSPTVNAIQLESVCDKSTRSVSVSANLGSDRRMEKNTKILLNCRACSRAKSSYDNHGFECFRCCNCSPSLPCSQSRQFTQRRWDRTFDSLHLTIRVNPSSHKTTTSTTQGFSKPESSVVQAQNRRLRHLCLRIIQDIWQVPLNRSLVLTPRCHRSWEDCVGARWSRSMEDMGKAV